MKLQDTFFSWSRCLSLCRKELSEDWRKHLLRILLIYVSLTLLFLFRSMNINHQSSYVSYDSCFRDMMVIGVNAILFAGCYSASLLAERLKSKTSRLSDMMTPVSTFEKYILRWTLFTVGFLLIFFLLFLLADYTRYLVMSFSYPEVEAVTPIPFFDYFYAPWSDNRKWTLFNSALQLRMGLSFYFCVQSLFVLGSTLWPKNAFLKTFAAVTVTGVTLVVVSTWLVEEILPSTMALPFGMAPMTFTNLVFVCLLLLTLFNWVVAYYRYKEMEIINRW